MPAEPPRGPAADSQPTKPPIGAEQFAETDLRVGRVLEVTDFAGARAPAWKLLVDFGPLGRMQTSAQVRNYSRQQLLGSMVIGAVNLGPRRIAGFTSEFLLLAAVQDGTRTLLLHPDEGAEPGDPVS